MKLHRLLLSTLLIGVSSLSFAQTGAPCLASVESEIKKFDADLKAHDADGKLDDKEKADLNASHSKLLDALTKAKADGNITPQECSQLQNLARKEAADMASAIGVRPKNHGRHKQAFAKRTHKHASMKSCQAEIKKEKRIFDTKFKAGIDSGKIDDKEKVDIEKVHNELLALEKKADDDGKVTADECADIHEKIMEENKKLNAAMDIVHKRPAKAGKGGKREKALHNKSKRGGKGKATRDVGHCQAEIADEKKEFAADLDKVKKAGHLSAAEESELNALQKTLLDYENKAKRGGISKKECDEIHSQAVHIHDKLVEADAKN